MNFEMDTSELLSMFNWPDPLALTSEQREAAWADIVNMLKSDPSWTFDESLLPPADNALSLEGNVQETLYEPVSPRGPDTTPQAWTSSKDYVTMLNAYQHVPKSKLPSHRDDAATPAQTSLLRPRPKSTPQPQPPTSAPHKQQPQCGPIFVEGHTSQHKFSCVCPCLGYTITVHKIGQGATCVSD